jgi:integrase
LHGGGFGFAPPKSEAGKRIIVVPAAIMPAVREHVRRLGTADDGLLFTSPEGTPLWHGNFRNRVWLPALEAARLPPMHFHDLRHTGNMLAAGTAAGLRELMDRMGHSTTRAALTYLHASDERQRAIAHALSKVSASELKRRSPNRSGTQRARKPLKVS